MFIIIVIMNMILCHNIRTVDAGYTKSVQMLPVLAHLSKDGVREPRKTGARNSLKICYRPLPDRFPDGLAQRPVELPDS